MKIVYNKETKLFSLEGTKYWAIFVGKEDGVRHEKITDSKKEAQEFLDKWAKKLTPWTSVIVEATKVK